MTAIMNVLLILIAVTVAFTAEPIYIIKSPKIDKPKKLPACLPLAKPCIKSNLPCCTLTYEKTYMGFGTVPTTCFKFGKGVCQVNQSIQNFSEYSRLITQLNSTNFRELRSKYWDSIPTTLACPQKVTIELKTM